ncbi:MAG: hypothetical protein F6K26_30620 [Moorea sp. SIO2I5]|nr:hypothetical protein [Moorena sp. SIO2I5]
MGRLSQKGSHELKLSSKHCYISVPDSYQVQSIFSRLPTPDSRFPIPYSLLPTP